MTAPSLVAFLLTSKAAIQVQGHLWVSQVPLVNSTVDLSLPTPRPQDPMQSSMAYVPELMLVPRLNAQLTLPFPDAL